MGVKGGRRRRGGVPTLGQRTPPDEAPWMLRALRSTLPTLVAVVFLAAGGAAAVMSSDTTAGAWLALAAVLAALCGAAFMSERIANRILEFFE